MEVSAEEAETGPQIAQMIHLKNVASVYIVNLVAFLGYIGFTIWPQAIVVLSGWGLELIGLAKHL